MSRGRTRRHIWFRSLNMFSFKQTRHIKVIGDVTPLYRGTWHRSTFPRVDRLTHQSIQVETWSEHVLYPFRFKANTRIFVNLTRHDVINLPRLTHLNDSDALSLSGRTCSSGASVWNLYIPDSDKGNCFIYIYIYIYIQLYTYTHTHTHTHKYIYTHTCIYIYVCIYIHTYM